ncbi:RmlC-like cupin domain-containing protein [Cytidiella melzeri]|nr:RmlC-like cupin domain-containing protein [Cytidiella melzeri]
MKAVVHLVAATAAFATTASALTAAAAAEEVSNLRVAQTQSDRIKLLPDDAFVFDFLHPDSGVTTGSGGHTVAASSENMPALIGNGMAMTIGFLGPCGMNTPHTHPRATEFNFAVNGSIKGGFLAENGDRFILHDVPPGSAVVFPQGAIHFEYNDSCEDMIFVAAFNNEDPGVTQIAQRFFGLPPTVVAAALGGVGVEEIAGLESKVMLIPCKIERYSFCMQIPDNIALGTADCLQRCGISTPTSGQPTDQRQPRVSANALPSGFSGPVPPMAAPTTASRSLASDSTAVVVQPGFQGKEASSGGVESASSSSGSKPNALSIALIVVVSVLAAGYIVIAALYLKARRLEKTRTMGNRYVKTGSTYAPQGMTGEKQPFESYSTAAEDLSTPYDPPSAGA